MSNIHDRARQLVAQSKGPMTTSEAYSALAKRRVKPQPGPESWLVRGGVRVARIPCNPPPTPTPDGGFWWMKD